MTRYAAFLLLLFPLFFVLLLSSICTEPTDSEHAPPPITEANTVPALGICPSVNSTLELTGDYGTATLTYSGGSWYSWVGSKPSDVYAFTFYHDGSERRILIELTDSEYQEGLGDSTTTDCSGTLATFSGANGTIVVAEPSVAPTLASASIDATGGTLTLTWDAFVDGDGEPISLSATGGALTATGDAYTDGDEYRTYTLSRTVFDGETVTVSLGGGVVISSSSSADCQEEINFPVTNNSTQTVPINPAADATLAGSMLGGGIL